MLVHFGKDRAQQWTLIRVDPRCRSRFDTVPLLRPVAS
jgi:hypothetical protein